MIIKKTLLVIALINLPLIAFGDDLVSFSPAEEEQGQCEWVTSIFEEKNIKVYDVPRSKGHKTNYTIDQSGHDVEQIDIAVHQPDQPVILKVTAYEPTIWNIGWTEKTKIFSVHDKK